ncbi:LPS translocon maturation chaperone LptM [Bordetella sp. H567]|uniref:LPS translocon maturation chaperone LptM n=1 Tax=Bordetella sp. H567 TaxID=1697043 RepID=UPI001F24837D|nr:lipoprotein [Bordetella sp. H567]
MRSSTCSANARNSVSFIIQSARITEFPVSHPAYSRTALRIVATLAAAASLAACGYKGPLIAPSQAPVLKPPPKVIAPMSFRAAPGVHLGTALPDYPPSATQR